MVCILQNEADSYRKVRLRVEDVQGRNVLTNFWVSSYVVGHKSQQQIHHAAMAHRQPHCEMFRAAVLLKSTAPSDLDYRCYLTATPPSYQLAVLGAWRQQAQHLPATCR